MGFARLALLGRPAVSAPGGRVVALPRSCWPVIGFLTSNWRRRLDREEVADTLWPDLGGRRARRCLSTALWRLRAVPGLGELVLPGESAAFALNLRARVHIDIIAFERRLERLLAEGPSASPGVMARGIRALALYRGDPFQRIDADWALVERERLRLMLLEGLGLVAESAMAAGNQGEAIRHATRLASLEPLREDIHRLLMRAYMARGARAKAIAQYRTCQGELATALGIEPMEETRNLYESLVALPDRRLAPSAEARRGAHFEAVAHRLRLARRASIATTRGIEEALQLIERAAQS